MEIVLNSFGVALSRDNEGFIISNGDGKQRVPVTGVTAIQLGRGAQITTDAIMLAVEHEIDILVSDRSGTPVARVWSPRFGSISTIRKGQLAFTASAAAVSWVKESIRYKIGTQQALLLLLQTDRPDLTQATHKAIGRMEVYRQKIDALEGSTVTDIAPVVRPWEGAASKIHFEALNLFLPEEYRFSLRTQHPAEDIANALLNYGYGMLYGKVEGALIRAGIDPYVGILHRDQYNRPVLVYDVIERYRTWIDYVVVQLLCQHAVTDEHVSVSQTGAYWLEALGRRILIQSVNDYLDEVVPGDGLQRSRATHIDLYAQRLAQTFKHYQPKPQSL